MILVYFSIWNLWFWGFQEISISTYIWVNFITTSLFSRSLESWLGFGKSSPFMAQQFRLVKYHFIYPDILLYWLVVWNMNFMTFHSVGNSNPNWWTHIFQRGRYTTNHISTVLSLIYLFRCANSRLATLEALAIFEWREYLVQMPLGSSVIVKIMGISWDIFHGICHGICYMYTVHMYI